MKNVIQSIVIVGSMVFAAVAHAVTLPGPVVSAEWLATHRDQVQMLDIRSDTKSYGRSPVVETDAKTGKVFVEEVGGTIPGSLLMDYKLVRAERTLAGQKTKYLVPEKAELESRLRATGLRADKPIVLIAQGVDPSDVMEALRMFWTFKVYGEDNIAVLDGGLAGWLVAQKAVDTKPVEKAPVGNWAAKGFRPELIADTAAVENASRSKTVVLDGRDAASYYGLTKRSYVSAFGHISGAKLLPPDVLFRSAQGALYFHAPAQYQALAKLAGLDASTPTIVYCNSGHLASGAWFMMSQMVGNKQASMYDGSLYLWTRDKKPLVGVLN